MIFDYLLHDTTHSVDKINLSYTSIQVQAPSGLVYHERISEYQVVLSLRHRGNWVNFTTSNFHKSQERVFINIISVIIRRRKAGPPLKRIYKLTTPHPSNPLNSLHRSKILLARINPSTHQ